MAIVTTDPFMGLTTEAGWEAQPVFAQDGRGDKHIHTSSSYAIAPWPSDLNQGEKWVSERKAGDSAGCQARCSERAVSVTRLPEPVTLLLCASVSPTTEGG